MSLTASDGIRNKGSVERKGLQKSLILMLQCGIHLFLGQYAKRMNTTEIRPLFKEEKDEC
jgi:hypothetical protein